MTDDVQERRETVYVEALSAAVGEYTEMEVKIKALGKRLDNLRLAIRGLAALTGVPVPDSITARAKMTVVVTEEQRSNWHKALLR